MAVTVTEIKSSFDALVGGAELGMGQVVAKFDLGLYVNPGGVPVALSDFGTNTVARAGALQTIQFSSTGDDGLHNYFWTGTAIKVFIAATGIEIANAIDLTAADVVGTAYFDVA